MAFEEIERLKSEWTDKWVVVDAGRPELARFRDAVGQVRTVNMNGRALVEFDQHADIGWYDIELPFLRQVPKPERMEGESAKGPLRTTEAKPPSEKPAKPAPAAAGKSKSTADILAAARGGASASPKARTPVSTVEAAAPGGTAEAGAATVQPGAAKKLSTSEILAAARAKKAQAGAPSEAAAASTPAEALQPAGTDGAETTEKPARPALSTKEILAAARGKPSAHATKPLETPAPSETPTAIQEECVSAPRPAASKPTPGDLPKTTADIIAWCRQRDTK